VRRALGQLGHIAQASLTLPFNYHGIQYAEVNPNGNVKMTLPVTCATACALAGPCRRSINARHVPREIEGV
jgi:hypothetical protein